MISKETVKELADLARIEISEIEVEKLVGEMGAILEYVGQVKSVVGDYKEGVEFGSIKNVFREDVDPTEPCVYSKELIAEFPEREGEYLKVKKILN